MIGQITQKARIGISACKMNPVSDVLLPDSNSFPRCSRLIAFSVYSYRTEVRQVYGLMLPEYAHRPHGNTKFEYMSDNAFLPKQDNVPHLACIVCDTHHTNPSESQITLGEMDAVLTLLTYQFGCGKFSDHTIKPVSIDHRADFPMRKPFQCYPNDNDSYSMRLGVSLRIPT